MRITKEIKTNEKRELWLGITSIAIMTILLASLAVSFVADTPLK